MKYVLEWTTRQGGSAKDNLASLKRSLELLSKWTPSMTVHQFVSRVDSRGGFVVGETDDPVELAKDCAIFSPFVEFAIHPVIDIEQGSAVLQAGVDFNETH
jgi:hypothetical protein